MPRFFFALLKQNAEGQNSPALNNNCIANCLYEGVIPKIKVLDLKLRVLYLKIKVLYSK